MIKTLIVMTTYGQIFFSKEDFFNNEKSETDISLTAGLISAIYNMTTETQQQKITELELEDDRSVFKELPGEKLFVITVDKRMDNSDADDLLDELAEAFKKKYGDEIVDGMILNDFEPVADEIVSRKIWYNTISKKLSLKDIFGSIALIFGFIFYPMWFLEAENNIINPLKNSLIDGFGGFLMMALLIGILTCVPFIVIFYFSKNTKVGLLFKFGYEYLRRPTRGGYAEQLPIWFLIFPIGIIITISSIVRYGRGLQYALTVQLWPELYESLVLNSQGESLLWEGVFIFLIFYSVSWFIIFPTLIGLITGDLSKRWYTSSITIMGYSSIIHIPTHILGGVFYHKLMGYSVDDLGIFNLEVSSLEYLFEVTLPINLFLFLYFYYLATGLNQLITKNRKRYPIALVLSFFAVLGLQNLMMYLLFRTDLYGPLF